jgi:DNA invertase Pin-like site-specific DNA recombinase
MPGRRDAPAANAEPEPQSVAIYTRVSTGNQVGGRFDSCEAQAAYCREKIERQKAEGWFEVACLTDAAYSGGTMDRPSMKVLKRMIEAGEVKIVLIYKLERVLRSTDEWVPFRAFLKKHGCRLESATEDLSENTPSGRLKNNLLMSVAEYERLNTAEKTRSKMLQQAKRGLWNGGYVPYGYAYDKNTQALQPHPEQAAVVRKIFEQAARLVSLTDLANELNAAGLRTKVRELQRRDGTTETVGGSRFRSDGLRLLIRNPIYRGAVRFGGQEYAAKHPPLVLPEIWDQANAATAETKPLRGYVFQERDAQNHLLKGLAFCGSCGRALVPNDSGKKGPSGIHYRYYTCSLVMRETAAAPCPVGRLSADALEKAVVALIGEASKHPTVVAEMVQTSRTMRRGDRDSLRAEVDRTKHELATVDKQLTNCADAVAKGGADALGEVLVRRATELRAERQRLLVVQERKRQELAACDAIILEERRITENLEKLGQALPNLPPQERKELVRLFIERVEVRRLMPNARRKTSDDAATAPEPEARVMELRIKLHLPELVRGMQERVASARAEPRVAVRALSLVGKVDFTNAQRGEVAIMAPFRQSFRLEARLRTVPAPTPKVEHAVVRAQRWQQLLKNGELPNRTALAKWAGLTPGAVTRILKLIELAPDIQAYLASLRTANAVWHFGIKPVGKLADWSFEKQRFLFAKMRDSYDARTQRLDVNSKSVAIAQFPRPTGPRSSPRLSM